MQLVDKIHAVDAGLERERSASDAKPALDIAGRLGRKIEGGWKPERRQTDAFVDIGETEAARRPSEHGEDRVEAVLEAAVERVLILALVEWNPFDRRERKDATRCVRIEAIASGQKIGRPSVSMK
jgi:hypothetical protein